jgi:hypothetical protein
VRTTKPQQTILACPSWLILSCWLSRQPPFFASCAHWNRVRANEYAEDWNLAGVTRQINGTGMVDHQKRVACTEQAWRALRHALGLPTQ